MNCIHLFIVLAALLSFSLRTFAAVPAITFSKDFEDGSLGKVERIGDTVFRCAVEGQHDERGHNRQASWYFFRMNHVLDRDLSLTLTDLVGEYNDIPGACPFSADIVPVFSYDGEHWNHFDSTTWDGERKEVTLEFHPAHDTIWIAHVPPYPHSRLLKLLSETQKSSCVRLEVIGKTSLGRDLHLVTVTNFEQPSAGKKTVWLQARQHAWEAGTSFVMEGALLFIISDDPVARKFRDEFVFKFTPMMDPDGCATGKVRFNAHGYDLNRHWNTMDFHDPEQLRLMPEIWHVKKALLGWLDTGHSIDLLVNLHNTESTEFLDTHCDYAAVLKRMTLLYDKLVNQSSFDPSRKLGVGGTVATDTNSLWHERRIPVLLMEQRIGLSKKLGRRPTVEDRLTFGRQLITVMAETVQP
ncbi:MAG: hypothetical protein JWM99_5098 [Verrucomicrobiales bacterium]|nr:hypothetical protein [Verrucomicrobiales bacterium]